MRPEKPTDAAIIGMGCIFPGAPDLETFRRNLEAGVDAISDVPASRWDPVFYDPESSAADRFYCKRGGFVDDFATFDALGFGIMPVAAMGAEPDQLIALEVAARALADSGYADKDFNRDRTGVILGRGNYIGAGMTRLEQHVRTAQQLVQCLKTLVPGITTDQLASVKAEFQSRLGGYGPDTAIGLVPNLTSSRIANRLDLNGPAYTVDAACASSLLAVDQACRELREKRADVVLAGGVHLSHDVAFWSVFCQLGALSRNQRIRPFDKDADGILIGEGVGIVVLKRVEDARRDGDRIYAVIRGTGVASDGREASLMVPRVDGQLLALQRAWAGAELSPEQIGLIEAHGTGTPVGDEAELATLARFFGTTDGERVGMGSVKSMIGHAMPAAGAAGLIKAALAVHDRVRYPTLHVDEPHPGMAATRFRTIGETEDWKSDGFLVAGVNAFGFGGINGHVVLQSEAPDAPRAARRKPVLEAPEEILLLAAGSPNALARAVDAGASGVGDGPCRLALVNPTPERRARAKEVVLKGKARSGRDGMWFTPKGLIARGGKIAFLFPGVEAQFDPRVDDVARAFNKTMPDLSAGTDLERQGAGVVAVGRLLHEVLGEVGVTPDVIAGHSVGEWTGMIVSEMIPPSVLDSFVAGLRPGSLEVPGVVFAACGGSAERIRVMIEDLKDVVITHDNCPHQIILCGPEAEVDVALSRMREARVLAQKLPFRSGFHSRLFSDYVAPHREYLSQLELQPAKTELWSATSCAPYPSDPAEIQALAIEHLTEPVRFRELLQTMWEQGVRIFVQLGTGSLVGFASDTLRKKPHLAMSTSVNQRSGMHQLRRLMAALFVEGATVDFGRPEAAIEPPKGLKLNLGVPLIQLSTPLETVMTPAETDSEHPVLAGFDDVMRELVSTQSAVATAWQKRGKKSQESAPAPTPKEATTLRRLSVATDPNLADHCLLPQPEGWSNLADRNPVVPMTMSIQMMIDAAQAVSGRTAIRLEALRAYKWLSVQPEVEVEIKSDWDGADRVKVAIKGYSETTVVVADAYPEAPDAREPLPADPSSLPIAAAQLYTDRWMFHGPAYRGVTDLLTMSDKGIRATLCGLEAEGGLLDNAGQLFGYWVMAKTTKDRLAMPIKIKRMSFFGPQPQPGEAVECNVWVGKVGAREVDCDMQLTADGAVWCDIAGWADWRFETDDRLWPVMHRTEDNLFATCEPEGFCLVSDPERSEASRDYLAARFLNERERDIYEQLAPRRKVGWLYGRIAAKDAARKHLTDRGEAPIFPVEIEVDNDDEGRPLLRTAYAGDLRVSIAHKDDVAVAKVVEGRDVGVDVERVEARSARFSELACSAEERELLPRDDWDAWLTRFWCAKEVYGKAIGTGLEGNPKQFTVTHVDGERLRIADMWIETRQRGDYIIGWGTKDG